VNRLTGSRNVSVSSPWTASLSSTNRFNHSSTSGSVGSISTGYGLDEGGVEVRVPVRFASP
jgi:hypothetical protein